MASTSHVKWEGTVADGKGHIETGSGAVDADYTAAGRFGDGGGTNPEELMAASHAACFSMALTLILGNAGHEPESVETDAVVTLRMIDGAPTITAIALKVVGTVPGIDEQAFSEHAEAAKAGCPVSRALSGVPEITLDAHLSQ